MGKRCIIYITSTSPTVQMRASQSRESGLRKAQEIGQPMDTSVVDAGGNLKAHVRMDGAFVGSITIYIQ